MQPPKLASNILVPALVTGGLLGPNYEQIIDYFSSKQASVANESLVDQDRYPVAVSKEEWNKILSSASKEERPSIKLHEIERRQGALIQNFTRNQQPSQKPHNELSVEELLRLSLEAKDQYKYRNSKVKANPEDRPSQQKALHKKELPQEEFRSIF